MNIIVKGVECNWCSHLTQQSRLRGCSTKTQDTGLSLQISFQLEKLYILSSTGVKGHSRTGQGQRSTGRGMLWCCFTQGFKEDLLCSHSETLISAATLKCC